MKLILLSFMFLSGAHAGERFAFSNACDFHTDCHAHGYVQDYGYGGLGGAVGVCSTNVFDSAQTKVAELVNGSCEEATEREATQLNCAGQQGLGYYQAGLQSIIQVADRLDPMQEELVFLTAAKDVRDFAKCQDGLFRSYLSTPIVKKEMVANAYRQFRDIADQLMPLLLAERRQRDREALRDSVIFSKIERVDLPLDVVAAVRESAAISEDIRSMRERIDALLSRIPMANRGSMKTVLEGLLLSNPSASAEEFEAVFHGEMLNLNESVQQTLTTFERIRRTSPTNPADELFCVDRSLKEQLYRSGQVNNSIEQMGLSEALRGFSCRARNRYGVEGQIALEVALIPTYFVGYGLARLAARAGVSTVRAIAGAGKTLASSTRAAMIGLEAADWASSLSSIERDCFNESFLSKVQGKACDPLDEVALAYEEASIAQCLTSVILPFASPLIGTTVRRVSTPRLDRAYEAQSPTPEIVVTAPRRKRLPLTRTQANRLSDGQRLEIIQEQLDGVVFERDQARAVLRLINNDDGAAAANELRRVFLLAGVSPQDIEGAVTRVIERGTLGIRIARTPLERAENVTGDLANRRWEASAPSLAITSRLTNLPNAVREKFQLLRRQGQAAPFTAVTPAVFDYKNVSSEVPTPLSTLLSSEMRAPHERAAELLSDTDRWTNYFEGTMAEVFERMLRSGNPRLVEAAQLGKFSEAILVQLFRERFSRRGINISVIEPRAGILSPEQFREKLKKGAIWDRAFEGSYTGSHGPFPHLFQLDYVIDEMVRSGGGKITRAQDFFDYWGGSKQGGAVWDDMFDLYDESKAIHYTLRDTATVTAGYLSKFGVVP